MNNKLTKERLNIVNLVRDAKRKINIFAMQKASAKAGWKLWHL